MRSENNEGKGYSLDRWLKGPVRLLIGLLSLSTILQRHRIMEFKRWRRGRFTETTIVEIEEGELPVEFKLVKVPVESSFKKARLPPSKVSIRLQTPEKVKTPKLELFTEEDELNIDKLFQDLQLRLLRSEFAERYGVRITDAEFNRIRSIFGITDKADRTDDVDDESTDEAAFDLPDFQSPPRKRARRQSDPLISGLSTLSSSLDSNENLIIKLD